MKPETQCLIPTWHENAKERRHRETEETMRRKEYDLTGEYRTANNLDTFLFWTTRGCRNGSLKPLFLKNADRDLRKAFKELSSLMRGINRRLVPHGAAVRICNNWELLRCSMANCISELHLDASRPRLDILITEFDRNGLPSDIHIIATVKSGDRDDPRYVRKHGHNVIFTLVRRATDQIVKFRDTPGPTGLSRLISCARSGADGWFAKWKEEHFGNWFNNKYEDRLTL